MMNALEAYRAGELSVVRAVSHSDEITLGLCVQALERMDAKFSDAYIASGLSPMCNSFNACLDFASDAGADILFHTASDVIVEPFALTKLLEVMDLQENYLSIAKGYDPMFGHGASVGIWIWNMRTVGREYRFRDVFKQDLDLCERIEAGTGKSRTYAPNDLQMGYHHPIWTAEELYEKILYSYPKYKEPRQNDMRRFLQDGLDSNPNNKALQAGFLALDRAVRDGEQSGSKDRAALRDLFLLDTAALHLDGSDFYTLHSAFKPYAQRALFSFKDCVCADEPASI
jgi:hypothetical protein